MKIVQINEYCGIESTGKISFELARILQMKGHDCKIIYGRKKAPAETNDYGIRMTKAFGVYIHGIETRIFDNHGFASTFQTLKMLSFLDNFKPDIIHLHNLHGYYINVAVLFRYIVKKKIPVIWTLHDCWAFTGHCAHFSQVGCEKWIYGCHDCEQKKQYPASYFLDNSKKNWKRKHNLFTMLNDAIIVTPSCWLSELAKKSYLNKYQIKVIPNGINLDIFQPKNSNVFLNKFNAKKIVLGVASCWNERKGIGDFIRLCEVFDRTEFQIVLVGKVAKDLKLPSCIYHIDRTDDANQLAEIYSNADVYVNLSQIEVLGTTTIEALACGCPVVTYEAGGNSETINESCGIIVKDGDINAVAMAVKKIVMLDRTSMKKMCVNQAQKFSRKRMVEDYYSFYRKILKYE